jgi:drug/metabolite transporter (DMT)-like permease
MQLAASFNFRHPLPPRWRTRWLAMIALLTLVGLLFSLNLWLASQRPPAWSAVFLSQLLPFLVWAALCPAVMWLNQLRPLTLSRLAAFHLLATALFSLLQIALYGLAYWVNLDRVKELHVHVNDEEQIVSLKDGAELTLSRRYREKVSQALGMQV